jgi:hypothetical protein
MCLLTDIALSGDRNVIIKKEAEERLKHKDLTTEVQRMWNVISAVITGASGTISKLFRECLNEIPGSLNEIPGKRDFKKVYKTAIRALYAYSGKCRCKVHYVYHRK